MQPAPGARDAGVPSMRSRTGHVREFESVSVQATRRARRPSRPGRDDDGSAHACGRDERRDAKRTRPGTPAESSILLVSCAQTVRPAFPGGGRRCPAQDSGSTASKTE